MNREDEEVTITLRQLATSLAVTAARYIGEDLGWALENWEVFMPAAYQVKDSFDADKQN